MSRIFLAGAAGVIGRRLTPLLRAHGHSVWGAPPDRAEHRLGLCRPALRPYREDAPLDVDAAGPQGVSVRGVASLERQVLAASPIEGLVLRHGRLYGPGSGADAPPSALAVHVDAAAHAALRAIDHGEPGFFNIADPSGEVSTDKATATLGWRPDFRIERE